MTSGVLRLTAAYHRAWVLMCFDGFRLSNLTHLGVSALAFVTIGIAETPCKVQAICFDTAVLRTM